MRQLGLTLAIGSLLAGVVACRTSEPAGANPPSSAASVSGGSAPVPPGAPSAAPRVYDQSVQSIDVAVGGRFTIALEANITTPLEWKLEPDPNPAVLALGERKYTDEPPVGCVACTGYGGTDSFSFVAKGPGEATLHFAYRELKPGMPPAKEITVRVRVSP
jgi:predicted secreted protein